MIEPTDEMVREIYTRIYFWDHDDSGIREGLAAVFAIVERDYELSRRRPKHPDPRPPGYLDACGWCSAEGRTCPAHVPFTRTGD